MLGLVTLALAPGAEGTDRPSPRSPGFLNFLRRRLGTSDPSPADRDSLAAAQVDLAAFAIPILDALAVVVKTTGEPEVAGRVAVERLGMVVGSDASFLLSRTGTGWSYLALDSISPEAIRQSPIVATVAAEEQGLAESALQRDEVIAIGDLAADHRWWGRSDRLGGLRSLALVPIRAGDDLIGVLGFAAERAGVFDEAALAAVHRAAPLLAAALTYRLERHRAGDLDKQLDLIERGRTEFLATVAHEFRTPLSSIKASSDVLLE
ncbi:MAG: GAF domain-containing protein, partial [Chloroflexi bacterium]|nr:GAF domain-containing protein [Chloroflexota bacterium]